MKKVLIIIIVFIAAAGAGYYLYAKEKKAIKVAVVIDDWGYSTDNLQLADSINAPLTAAVLPNLIHSKDIAEHMHRKKNREIILHMPCEPQDTTVRLEEGTILTFMGEDKIIGLVNSAIKTVPYAKGLSNHMGSKATQNKRVMSAVMKALKKNKLYFFDSMAVSFSAGKDIAAENKVKSASRDIFLDNIPSRNYISKQFDMLVQSAMAKGYAIGVGHDKRLTLEVIRDKVKEYKAKGIRFVVLSRLVR